MDSIGTSIEETNTTAIFCVINKNKEFREKKMSPLLLWGWQFVYKPLEGPTEYFNIANWSFICRLHGHNHNNNKNNYYGRLFATSCVVQTDLRSRSYWQQDRVQNEIKRKTTNGGQQNKIARRTKCGWNKRNENLSVFVSNVDVRLFSFLCGLGHRKMNIQAYLTLKFSTTIHLVLTCYYPA